MTARTPHLTAPRVCRADVAALAAACDGPVLVLGAGAWRDLQAECGSVDAVVRWLAALATRHGRPIGVNLPTGPDTSSTVMIPPRDWSRARLAATMAAAQPALERAFGAATERSA
jgi:hypothetical protein